MADFFGIQATTATHQPKYNSPSDDSSSSDDSEHEPSRTVSQNNNPTLKDEEEEEEKKKKKKKKKKKAGPELRLLCSYGGEIVVNANGRPTYRGGENRLITVEPLRRCTFYQFHHLLSFEIFQGPHYPSCTLKYTLPTHGLDLLITIRTDEELQNMIKEYEDHINSKGKYFDRSDVRLFLFPVEDPLPIINPAATTTTTTTTASGASAVENL